MDVCLFSLRACFCASNELLQSSELPELREQKNICYVIWIHVLEAITHSAGQCLAVFQQARQCQMPLFICREVFYLRN